uniref:Uncharacterized protein n=1 Tax=Cannabis sativa TaxID=3483 RepID=A0A803R9X7_CANSA
MEESQCDSHSGSCGFDLGLPNCLQCLQECPNRGPLPPLQAGLGLILFPNKQTPHFLIICSYYGNVSLSK